MNNIWSLIHTHISEIPQSTSTCCRHL